MPSSSCHTKTPATPPRSATRSSPANSQDNEVRTQRRFAHDSNSASSASPSSDEGGDASIGHIRSSPRSLSSRRPSFAAHSTASHALESLRHARGIRLGEREGGDRSFFKDAESELPPAPKVGSRAAARTMGGMRSNHASFSEDAMESLRTVDKEASTTVHRARGRQEAKARLAQLSQSLSSSPHSSNGGRTRYSLTREHREDSYAGAQEWAATLHRRESIQKPVFKDEDAGTAAATRDVPAVPAAAKRFDDLGIPTGREEGVTITAYKSAVYESARGRKRGISGKDSREDIENYWTGLVNAAKAQEGSKQHYFATKGREAMLAEVPSERMTALSPSGSVDSGDGEEESIRGGVRKRVVPARRNTVPVVAVEAAEEQIANAAKSAEWSIAMAMRSAKRSIEHQRAILKAREAHEARSRQASQGEETREETRGGRHGAEGAQRQAGGGGSRLHEVFIKGHSEGVVPLSRTALPHFSAAEARKDLESSIDRDFSATRSQDSVDARKLHGMGDAAAADDLEGFLDSQNKANKKRDMEDERRLRGGGDADDSGDSATMMAKMEMRDSAKSEAEYQSALRDALRPPKSKSAD